MRQFKSPISPTPGVGGTPNMGYPKWAQYPIVTLASQTGVNVIWASGGAIKQAPNRGPRPLFGPLFGPYSEPLLGQYSPSLILLSRDYYNMLFPGRALGGPKIGPYFGPLLRAF